MRLSLLLSVSFLFTLGTNIENAMAAASPSWNQKKAPSPFTPAEESELEEIFTPSIGEQEEKDHPGKIKHFKSILIAAFAKGTVPPAHILDVITNKLLNAYQTELNSHQQKGLSARFNEKRQRFQTGETDVFLSVKLLAIVHAVSKKSNVSFSRAENERIKSVLSNYRYGMVAKDQRNKMVKIAAYDFATGSFLSPKDIRDKFLTPNSSYELEYPLYENSIEAILHAYGSSPYRSPRIIFDDSDSDSGSDSSVEIEAHSPPPSSPPAPPPSTRPTFPHTQSTYAIKNVGRTGPVTIEESKVQPGKLAAAHMPLNAKKLIEQMVENPDEVDPETRKQLLKDPNTRNLIEKYQKEKRTKGKLDYMTLLKIPEAQAKIRRQFLYKVAVVDGFADLKSARPNLTESTEIREKELGKQLPMQHLKAAHMDDSHADHVINIITRIAPKVKISYHSFHSAKLSNVLENAIKSQPAFISMSMSSMDRLFNGMSKSMQNGIINAAKNNIGVIVALGNSANSEKDKPYIRDLFALAENPDVRGNLLIVVASAYDKDGNEKIAPYSNTPLSDHTAQYAITAPGSDIESKGVEGIPVIKSGTSMATPIVSGICALLKNHLRNNGLDASPKHVFDLLKASARTKTNQGTLTDFHFGAGIVNLEGAMILALKEAGKLSPERTDQLRIDAVNDLDRSF